MERGNISQCDTKKGQDENATEHLTNAENKVDGFLIFVFPTLAKVYMDH